MTLQLDFKFQQFYQHLPSIYTEYIIAINSVCSLMQFFKFYLWSSTCDVKDNKSKVKAQSSNKSKLKAQVSKSSKFT